MHTILFIIFGVVCVAGAVNFLAQSHPINSALSLIVVMAGLAPLYLLLGAEFPAVVQIIVYAGAIMVLFTFVIMLLNAGAEEVTKGSRVALILGVPALILSGTIGTWVILRSNPNSPTAMLPMGGTMHGSAQALGRLLFRDFLLPFEVTSVLILIAIMGAVVLARRGEN